MSNLFKKEPFDLIESYAADQLKGSGLQEHFQGEGHTDTLLVLADGAIPVHGAILGGSSPFFRIIFESHIPNFQGMREIIMPDYRLETMQLIVNLLYTGATIIPDSTIGKDVLQAAEYLQFYDYNHLKPDDSPVVSSFDIFSETSVEMSSKQAGSQGQNSAQNNSTWEFQSRLSTSTTSIVEILGGPATLKTTRRSVTFEDTVKNVTPQHSQGSGRKKLSTEKQEPETYIRTITSKTAGHSSTNALSCSTFPVEATINKQSLSTRSSSCRKEVPEIPVLESSSLDFSSNISERPSGNTSYSSTLRSTPVVTETIQSDTQHSDNSCAAASLGTDTGCLNTVCTSSSKDKVNSANLESVGNDLRNCQFCSTSYRSICDANQCLKSHGMKRCYICFHLFSRDLLFQHFNLSHSLGKESGEVECTFCGGSVTFQTARTHFEKLHLKNRTKTKAGKKLGTQKEMFPMSSSSPPYTFVPPPSQIYSELFDNSPVKSPLKKRIKLASEQIRSQNFELGNLTCSVSSLKKDNMTCIYIRENSLKRWS